MQIDDIFNLEKYPLNQLDSAEGKDFINSIRNSLDEDGSCTLEKFVTQDALQLMAEQAVELVDLAYAGPTSVSPYFFNYKIAEGMDVDEHHPTRRTGKRNLSQVASDLMPESHVLSILYRSPQMLEFLSWIRGIPIYCNQDKYQSLNISMMDRGGCQQWHFDTGRMVTTLLLQAPESGGEFEYAPNIRSDADENFDEVEKVLDGISDRVKRLKLQEGTLSLFQGHYSLHRVTEVQGARTRIQGILGYATQPDLVGNLESSILHYGPRVAELESVESMESMDS